MTHKAEQGPVSEGAPRLNIKAFPEMIGKRILEVKGKAKNAAGEAEIAYIIANPNSAQANKLKDGNWHFFFGAADGVFVPFVRWRDDRFDRNASPAGYRWFSGGRAVLRA